MTDGMTIETARISASQWSVSLMNGEARFTDQINLRSAKARDTFLARIKAKFPGVDAVALGDELDKLAASLPTGEAEAKSAEPASPPRQALFDAMPEDSRQAAMEMLKSPELLKQILDDIETLGAVGEKKIVGTLYLLGVSRLLDKPLASIVQGPSTSGKSFLVETVARLFPPEAKIMATDLTPQCLYYMPDGSLSHRWIVAGERSRIESEEQQQATKALREILTSGELNKLIPEKSADGTMKTRIVHQSGPIAFSQTTTLSNVFGEDSNRCVLLQTNETQEQTRRILLATVTRCGKPVAAAIANKHHAIQRALAQLPVAIPFEAELARKFTSEKCEARRAFPHLLSAIRACALIHQFQRDIVAGEVIASPQDYEICKRLLAEPMGRLLSQQLSPAAKRFYERIKVAPAFSEGIVFSSAEVYKKEKSSNESVRNWLHELTHMGYAEIVEPSRGGKPATWRMLPDDGNNRDGGLLPDLGGA